MRTVRAEFERCDRESAQGPSVLGRFGVPRIVALRRKIVRFMAHAKGERKPPKPCSLFRKFRLVYRDSAYLRQAILDAHRRLDKRARNCCCGPKAIELKTL